MAWLLGMDWRKAFLAVGLGVIVAGVVVLLITLGVTSTLRVRNFSGVTELNSNKQFKQFRNGF